MSTVLLAVISLSVLAAAFFIRTSAKNAIVGVFGDQVRDDLLAIYGSATNPDPGIDKLVPMPYTGFNPYGVNVFLDQEVQASDIRHTLQMIKDAGFGWVKQELLWSDIETPAKGSYIDTKNGGENSWTKWDRIVNLTNEYGLQLIFRIDTSPGWAHPGTSKIETPPDNYQDFGDFVYQVVKRYRGRVKYYQIWNEPNTAFEWGNRPISAKDYVHLLKIAYTRAKEADPNAVILSAALAPTIEVSQRAVNDVLYLQQMYDAGAKNYFDIMSANPYGLRSGPWDRRLNDNDVNFSRPLLLRDVMVHNGDADKPIWASEMGWDAVPPNFPAAPILGRVTRQQQASYTVQGFRRIFEEWPWMGVVNVWHFRRVFPVNQNEVMYYFGLVGQDYKPFPVYYALKNLATPPPIAYRGYHQEYDWTIKYSGHWMDASDPKAQLGTYKYSEKAGDSLSFKFMGTKLSLVTPKGPDVGGYEVTVDGATPSSLPRDANGHAVLDLYSPQQTWQQLVPVVSGLSFGAHDVKLQAIALRSGETKWYFDACIVDGMPVNLALLIWPGLAALFGLPLGAFVTRLMVPSPARSSLSIPSASGRGLE